MGKDYFRSIGVVLCYFAFINLKQLRVMIKRTIPFMILCAIALLPDIANAKVLHRHLNILQSSVPDSKSLATDNMEFIYDFFYSVDTVSNSIDTRDKMMLQISPEMSKFSSYTNMNVDSLINTMSPDEIVANAEKLVNGIPMIILKDYAAGKFTHSEKICLDWFKYEEPAPEFEWELVDSVTTVLGYECKGARCSFRGREWMVYYCEEIPVMDGPWKFHGLPGLIMAARDANKEYAFECISINSHSSRDITVYDVPYNNTTRKKFYDTLHRYDTNPFSYYQTTTGGSVTVTDEAGNPDLTAFDPMELDYDYIERDWREK